MDIGSVVAFIVCVLVDIVAPAILVVLLVRRNFRNRPVVGREHVFWLSTLIYLAPTVLLGWGVIELVIHPQVEGLAFFSAAMLCAFVALPGSAVSVILSVVLLGFHVPESFFLGSHVAWFVIGAVTWALVNAVLLRRIVQSSRARRRLYAPLPTVAPRK